MVQRLTKEALVWHRLRDGHVLEFLGVDSETFASDLCVVSPWMRHGTILQYRKTHGASNINIDRRVSPKFYPLAPSAVYEISYAVLVVRNQSGN